MTLATSWIIYKVLGIPLVVFVLSANSYEDRMDGGPRGVLAITASRTLLALWCAGIFIRGLFW